jgi:hypothetical protein
MSLGLGRVFEVGTPGNRLLRFSLAVLALLPMTYVFARLVLSVAPANDLAIALTATERWLAGGQPYDPASFGVTGGPELPFLYPPFVLPLLAPVTVLPEPFVLAAWVGTCLAAAVYICRRLRVPWLVVPFILMARPFAEGILAGNVQVLLVAAFVTVFFRAASGPRDMRPVAMDPADRAASGRRAGALTAAIPAMKLSQPHAWAYLLGRRWRAAVGGAAVVAGAVALTLPLTGLALWGDWIRQLQDAVRNGGPAGMALGTYVGPAIGSALLIASVVAVRFVPRREPGVWIGVLTVIAAPSVHAHAFTYLLPAWLLIRREIALVAALFGASLWDRGLWTGALIVIVTLCLSVAFPRLREPD